MLLYSKTKVTFQSVLEKQSMLNNGKGLILCHIRKVTSTIPNSISNYSKRNIDYLENYDEPPRSYSNQIAVEEQLSYPLTTDVKSKLENFCICQQDSLGKGTVILKRGVPIEKLSLSQIYHGYFHSSMGLMHKISQYGSSNYQKLYKELLEES